MGKRRDDSIAAMRSDIAKDREALKKREEIVAILAKLPDDDARRRVIRATAILMGIDL